MSVELEIMLRPEIEIYNELEREATELGVTIEELCRFIIGTHVSGRVAFRSPPINMQSMVQSSPEFNKLIKLSELMIKQTITSGVLKCPHCTQTLTFESLENGECSACGNKL